MGNLAEIIIDGFRFDNMQNMRYWSHGKTYDPKKKKEESKYMCRCGDYYGSRKYDGAWNMLIKDMEGKFHLRSRTESVNGGYTDKAEWIPWITKELEDLPNGTVLLGEICFPNNEGSRKITSVLNCLKDKCIERQKKNGILHYYVFDVLAYNGKSLINCVFEDRIKIYLEKLTPIAAKAKYVFLAKYKSGEELWELYGQVIAEGGEGIVITRKDCKYLCGKRTARMTLKIKKEINETIDAFLTGNYTPATLEYKGKFIEDWCFWYNQKTGEKVNKNKFIEYTNGEPWIPMSKGAYYGWGSSVEFAVFKDGVITPIGYISGIPDSLKQEIAEKTEDCVGRVAELSAMEVECIDGNYSLRHGKIITWRSDKRAEDCDFSQITDAS